MRMLKFKREERCEGEKKIYRCQTTANMTTHATPSTTPSHYTVDYHTSLE
jgi:hypothetical protein